jgi:hypothetical protein
VVGGPIALVLRIAGQLDSRKDLAEVGRAYEVTHSTPESLHPDVIVTGGDAASDAVVSTAARY